MKTIKTLALISLPGLLLSPSPMPAQTFQTPVWPANANSKSLAQIDPIQSDLPAPTPAGNVQPAPQTQPIQIIQRAPAPAAPAPDAATQPSGHILLNFQGAQLSDVLNYLSQAAGFIIVQDVPVTGTVNVISRQPVTPEEAVDLLNTVLIEKNFVALRSGRILKIVNRADAQKLDLPVITGADPAQIPQKDNVVTQILPVRYADVSKLIDNLRPLLSDNAAISANDASNAIILTDTQANVKRIAEIISALDTSISGVSTMRVFALRYADAKELADVLTQLFQSTNSSSGGTTQPAAPGGFPGFGGFGGGGGRRGGGGGGGGDTGDSGKSEAREAASRVVAVADETSNSIIVDAPQEYMESIGEIVNSLDTNITGVTETRIFTLLHADATEMAGVLSTLYSDSTTTGSQTQTRGGRQGGFGGFGFGPQQPAAAANTQSQRAIQEARVVVVADARTNSVIVTASRDSMEDVALTIGRLDSSDSKKQHVQIYTLENADPDNVAEILRDMFTTNGTSSSTTQTSEDALSQRTETGASSDIVNTLNTTGNSGGGGGGGGNGIR